MTVSGAGFKTEVRKGVTLTVGEQRVLNISLQVGEAGHGSADLERDLATEATVTESSHIRCR